MTGRIAAIAGFVAAASFLAVSIGATALFFQSLPSRRGRIEIPGLVAPVDARYDRRGVPHVRAVLEVDAWRAMGFIHASDRLFQMELRRRAAAGRLSEILGPRAIPADREARILGYATLARRDYELLGEQARAALAAYADGVNAFLAEQTLPLELRALSVTPDPWTPVDSLAFARLMQDGLSVAESVERGALDDARVRGLDAAVALLDASEPGISRVAPETAALLAGGARAAGVFRAFEETAPAGSNAWALAGSRTASGKPLLAGDPHLGAERPGTWYAAHLQSADGLDAAGLTLAGAPGIIIGHNGRVAWTLTMHQADDSDLFIEQVDWAASTYRRNDAWVPLDRTTETIKVRNGESVDVDVARTIHGPIVLTLDDHPGFALARAFAPADRPQGPGTFLEAARARNGAGLVATWSRYPGTSVNVCWADVQGAIGMKVAGAIPRRLAGDGRFPAPGWTSRYDWDGSIPGDALPELAAPGTGLVVNANDDWQGAGLRIPYPGLFADPDRENRARQLGSGLRTATVDDMRAMQLDVYSPYAARVVSALRGLTFNDPRAAKAAAVLAGWDARAATRGPSRLFFAFMKELRNAPGPSPLRVTWSMLDRMIEGSAAQSFWDDKATPQVETRGATIEQALIAAITRVEGEDGADPARWSFGKAHQLSYRYVFASVLPASIARRLAIGPVALPGEWHTLAVAGFPLRGERYDVSHIASARLIVDLSDPDASRLVLPLGQSGQLFDRHAKDQLAAWSAGRDFPFPFTAKAVDAATISTVRFVAAD